MNNTKEVRGQRLRQFLASILFAERHPRYWDAQRRHRRRERHAAPTPARPYYLPALCQAPGHRERKDTSHARAH